MEKLDIAFKVLTVFYLIVISWQLDKIIKKLK